MTYWTRVIQSKTTSELNCEDISEIRANTTQFCEVLSSSCVSARSLVYIWEKIKANRYEGVKDIKIISYKHKTSMRQNSYVVKEEKDKIISVLQDSSGRSINARTNKCKQKSPVSWTMDEFSRFIFPRIDNLERLDMFKADPTNEVFYYLIVPDETNFDSFMSALISYLRLLEATAKKNMSKLQDIYVWHKAFYLPSTQRSFFENREKVEEYKQVITSLPKFMNCFNSRLLFLDNWKQPSIFSSSLCFYELYSNFRNMNNTCSFFYSRTVHDNFRLLFNINDEYEVTHTIGRYSLRQLHIREVIETLDPCRFRCSTELDSQLLPEIFCTEEGGFAGMLNVVQEFFVNLIAKHLDNTAYEVVIDVPKRINNTKQIVTVVGSLRKAGIWMRQAGYFEASRQYLEKCLDYSNFIKTTTDGVIPQLAHVLVSLARTYLMGKEIEKSSAQLTEATKIVREQSSKSVTTEVLRLVNIVRAEICLETEMIKEAVQYYEDALNSLTCDGQSILLRATVRQQKKSSVVVKLKKGRKQSKPPSLWASESTDVKLASKLENEDWIKYKESTIIKIQLCLALAKAYENQEDSLLSATDQYETANAELQSLELANLIENAHVEVGIANKWIYKLQYHLAITHLNKAASIVESLLGDCNPVMKNIQEKLKECKAQFSDFDDVHSQKCSQIERLYFGKGV